MAAAAAVAGDVAKELWQAATDGKLDQATTLAPEAARLGVINKVATLHYTCLLPPHTQPLCSLCSTTARAKQIREGKKSTALHEAGYKGWYKIVEVLLANGADPKAEWKGNVSTRETRATLM